MTTPAPRTIQRRFGFEIEVPVLLTERTNKLNVVKKIPDTGDPHAPPRDEPHTFDLEYDIYDEPSQLIVAEHDDVKVHVDHSAKLNGVFYQENLKTDTGYIRQGLLTQLNNLREKVKGRPDEEALIAALDAKERQPAPIIEFVTAPWDEGSLTEDQVRQKMQTIATLAKTLETMTKQGTERVPLKGIMPEVSEKIFVGASPNSARQQISPMAVTGYIQATYGIKLSKIPELFTETAKAGRQESNEAGQALLDAKRIAGVVWDGWEERYNEFMDKRGRTPVPATGEDEIDALFSGIESAEDRSNRLARAKERERPRLRGFFTLLCNYLVAGRTQFNNPSPLLKNQLGQLFYKSGLNSVVDTFDTDTKDFLKDHASAISSELMSQCGREAGSPLVAGSKQTCQGWLETILMGGPDTFFPEAKNPYSEELKPEDLGPSDKQEKGVIIENRGASRGASGKDTGGQAAAANKQLAPDQWADLAVDIYKMVRQLNGYDAPENESALS